MKLSTAASLDPPDSVPAVDSGMARAALEAQFDHLIAANGPALMRLAATYTNTASDRDDLFQDIAVAVWLALPRFRGESSERTFLFRVAHNRAIDYLRKHRSLALNVEAEPTLADSRPSPEAGFAREQQGERLRAAIRSLPLAHRQILSLVLEEMSYSEIADVLGISETNVGARLNRARHLLRERMEKHK